MTLERLQKIIGRSGLASRRHAEELIVSGRVTVDGKVIRELGSKADDAASQIRVDGKLIRPPKHLLYIAMNKPRECVTTRSDPEHRQTVMDLLRGVPERVYPVGRLDYHSEGLLLLTNDGDFANSIANSSIGVPKTYWVKVSGVPDEKKLERLRAGIRLGRIRTRPARIKLLSKVGRKLPRQSRQESANPWYEVVLQEGKQNQIRRMFESVGNPVRKLKRVSIGSLSLGKLAPGASRLLTQVEVRNLIKESSSHE